MLQRNQNDVQDWNYGQRKIELYINDNLEHIKQIFRFSVAVMIAGGILISAAIILALLESLITKQASILASAEISGIAGIITEFIGATVLLIYHSTIRQATTYIRTLERINSIDMAMNITNSMSNKSTKLKDKTKADMVGSLLQNIHDLGEDNIQTGQKKIRATNGGKKIAIPEA